MQSRVAAMTAALTLTTLSLVACTANTTSGAQPADTVLRGAVLWTGTDETTATALAITDGTITYVGDDAGVTPFIGTGTETIDLAGRFVMPGLVDGHVHTRLAANAAVHCSLEWAPLSVDETLSMLQDCLDQEKADGVADTEVFYANDWMNISMTPANTVPTAALLDQLDTTRPVVVRAFDWHNAWTNSAAIEVAGLDATTPDPPDGIIERAPDGTPSGYFLDGGQTVLLSALPPVAIDVLADEAITGVASLRAAGVTTFQEAAIFSQPDFAIAGKTWQAARAKADIGDIHTSAYVDPAAWQADPQTALAQMNEWAATYGTDGITVRTAKFFLDGVPDYPAQTAAMLHEYLTYDDQGALVPSGSTGQQYMSPELLTATATALLADGWTLHMHALGDGAVREALDAIEAARAAHPDQADVRHTIVHLQMVDAEDVGRFAALGTVANFQPQWAQRNALTMEGTLGFVSQAVWDRQYPIREIVDAGQATGIPTAAVGSDWPVDPLDPFLAMQVLVTRTNPDPPEPSWAEPLGGEQAVTVQQALKIFTYDGAWAMGLDERTGSLEVGKEADVIVLDRNLLTAEPSTIAETTVLKTFVDGHQVGSEK